MFWEAIKNFFRALWEAFFTPVEIKATPIYSVPKFGDVSASVGILQQALNAKGFELKVDNDFGPKTRDALKAFQKSVDLKGTGIIPSDGGETFKHLGLELTRPPAEEPHPIGSRTPWMDIVMAEVGKVAEIPGPENHPVIVESHKIAGLAKALWHDLTAWCASYHKRVYVKAGVKPETLAKFKAWARDYTKFGVASAFRYGCSMVFERNEPGGDSHVTWGIKEEKRNGVDGYVCAGGNQGNSVKLSWYPKSDLLAIRWPSEQMLIEMGVAPNSPKSPQALEDLEEGAREYYRVGYAIQTIDKGRESQVAAAGKRVLRARARYEALSKIVGIPWWVIGALDNMESSCNPKAVLHNGQEIIGTGKKTTWVPKGRGPFDDWVTAGVDAINLNGSRWKALQTGSLDIGDILYACERFNGTGHILGAGREDTSPYIWACTSINDDFGKYVSDGKYDPTADANGQVGVAPLIKWLEENGHIQSVLPAA